ncbi:MAG TPA: L-threonylcarbamoyladenylate synthase [Actinomycetota bacterium]|nr:L-threonylcarbamoyladenylate synthase [Actinomycetota bacterium]
MSSPIEGAVAAALRGELIVFPTDTVYGIGTRPDDPAALARIFDAKRRPRELTLPVLVPSVAAARELAEFDDRAERLAAGWWPGALTIVLPRGERSRGWELGGASDTIGVRMPHDPMALAVLAGAGPLAVTSANRSGAPTPAGCDALVEAFGDLVAVYLCRDEPLGGAPSTVVDLASAVPRVLREGSIPRGELEPVLSR